MDEGLTRGIADKYPDWKAPSPKEEQLNAVLLAKTDGRVRQVLSEILLDKEINLFHSYGNAVSVRRLGYNDHGPVHARITTYNALKIMRLLSRKGVLMSLEEEEVGTFEDSQVAVVLGCFLHDVGMGVTREAHEWHSIALSDDHIKKYLYQLYPEGDARRVVLRALAHEIIVGHMAMSRIHSLEAGIVLVADGTDMSRGRSRIPSIIDRDPVVGDMHRYSASAITRVELKEGVAKPVQIVVQMENKTGLFQVEEVLMSKIKASPIISYVEVVAQVGDEPPRFYLR